MTLESDSGEARRFVETLQAWFDRVKRPFPWRAAYDPYAVWISEIMLQQTQAERGARYFIEWMRRFPDIRSVAMAQEREVLAAWEGLGYYSRARNLKAAAVAIMERHGGRFPESMADIRSLPGVGEYTAGAIASIAFNLPEPAVDANVLRIFARLCDIDAPTADKRVKTRIADLVRALMPADSPRRFSQALMELGALVCGKRAECGRCPVSEFCVAFANGTVAERPAGIVAKQYRRIEAVAAIVVRGDRVLVRRRPEGGLWAGMWELPGGTVEAGESPESAAARVVRGETGLEARIGECIGVVRHGYTVHRVTLHGFFCDIDAGQSANLSGGCVWTPIRDLPRYPFSAGQRKLLERLGWK